MQRIKQRVMTESVRMGATVTGGRNEDVTQQNVSDPVRKPGFAP
jgi:hypothetical protein